MTGIWPPGWRCTGRRRPPGGPRPSWTFATIGTKTLKKRGQLPELDESEEINACSIHVPAQVDGQSRTGC